MEADTDIRIALVFLFMEVLKDAVKRKDVGLLRVFVECPLISIVAETLDEFFPAQRDSLLEALRTVRCK